MKNLRILHAGLALVVGVGLTSCTTTYDAYGRPVQSVDPGAAVIGAVAIGAAAYAIGSNNNSSSDYHGYSGGGYRCRPYYPPRCRY